MSHSLNRFMRNGKDVIRQTWVVRVQEEGLHEGLHETKAPRGTEQGMLRKFTAAQQRKSDM